MTARILPLLLALLLVGCGKKGDVLQVRMEPGTDLLMTMQMDQTMDMKLMGQEIKNDTSMLMEMSMSVKNGDASNLREVTLVYDRMVMEVKNGHMDLAFDSANPEAGNEMLGMSVQPLIGKSIVMVLDDKLVPVEVRGLDELMQSNPASAKMMEQMLSKDTLGQMIGAQYELFFPEDAVRKGDSWDVEIELPVPQLGSATTKGTIHHRGYDDVDGARCIILNQVFELKMDLSNMSGTGDPRMQAMGVKIEDGTMTGVVYWDNKLGQARKAEMKQIMTMTMKNPMNGETMSIPMVQDIKMAIRPKE